MDWLVEEKFSFGHIDLLSRWNIKYIIVIMKIEFGGYGVRGRFGNYPGRH